MPLDAVDAAPLDRAARPLNGRVAPLVECARPLSARAAPLDGFELPLSARTVLSEERADGSRCAARLASLPSFDDLSPMLADPPSTRSSRSVMSAMSFATSVERGLSFAAPGAPFDATAAFCVGISSADGRAETGTVVAFCATISPGTGDASDASAEKSGNPSIQPGELRWLDSLSTIVSEGNSTKGGAIRAALLVALVATAAAAAAVKEETPIQATAVFSAVAPTSADSAAVPIAAQTAASNTWSSVSPAGVAGVAGVTGVAGARTDSGEPHSQSRGAPPPPPPRESAGG